MPPREIRYMSLRGIAEGAVEHYEKRPFVYPDQDERIEILAYEYDWSLLAVILYLKDGSQWPIGMEELPSTKGKQPILEYLKGLGYKNVEAEGAQYLGS